MTPYYQDELVTLWHGDCVQVMRELPDASVDAVVTDPPYGLEFMGKDWDAPWKQAGDVVTDPASVGGFQDGNGGNPFSRSRIRYGREGDASLGFQQWFETVATECLRVLKPGGHLLAFGGTRTWHRLAVAVEDAGFEVRDSIAWMYGSGFPKSLDVSKAIDKAAGAEREVVGRHTATIPNITPRPGDGERFTNGDGSITAPATPAAQQWQGWGTALKPAFEPIVVARKPLIGTVAENVLAHGTGALNIDGCRIGYASEADKDSAQALADLRARGRRLGVLGEAGQGQSLAVAKSGDTRDGTEQVTQHGAGRWPANVILDESQAAELDRQSGVLHSQDPQTRVSRSKRTGVTQMGTGASVEYGDTGGASRFFYVPKAGSSERPRAGEIAHPTVKPLELMRYLVKLVTPPGGTVLEPFAGSGTTLEACVIEGFQVIGIELTEDYLPLITQRITKPIEQVLL